ncbi:MAG: carbamoyl-phosphate synthase (glutamine-hydrolyzing) large subunit [Candidatus Bathyarchaeota archaeon]|nr:carbamoyl-phosphate synthase (glutamine-hydrolyzing) large subunit [Candidatus Bathyarchaeota archaeon]
MNEGITSFPQFDYSGSQALKALREENIEAVLINPNIATIQTSYRMADKVYLEPCVPEILEQIIKREKPDGILLGFGGQTGLNLGIELHRMGILQREGVRVLGTNIETIERTEDRELFKESMEKINVPIPLSEAAYTVDDSLRIGKDIGYPVIVRVAYTLGGGGSGIAKNRNELKDITRKAFKQSMVHQVLIEQSLNGWKEIEYEVMRDFDDNTITVAGLENFDPLGIHTGDSIVVAPTQTLTNREYQMLRSASIRVIRGLGIIGECNIQFGLDPESEKYVTIEVNARLSRSSALASKATGYPLAYISAKLAIGYLLPELKNKVTGVTTACFEPTLDYLVVKIPRWDFQKFKGARYLIGPQMKSVGEVMGIGRCFEEALQKAIRELEIDKSGFVCNDENEMQNESKKSIIEKLQNPTNERLFLISKALKSGISVEEISEVTKIDAWFIHKLQNIIKVEAKIRKLKSIRKSTNFINTLKEAKKLGFSDGQLAKCLSIKESKVRSLRKNFKIFPSFKIIDTMAAEWASQTNYCYITYGGDYDDIDFRDLKKILVLGSGCIRIGSSVEFDYCTMNTVWAIKEEGLDEVIVLNNNPETVSTDFDMSDKLYFEEITLERVMDIIERENPIGTVVSVGGQTSNNLAIPLMKNGFNLIGTTATSIDMAEDRSKFSSLLRRLGVPQPRWRMLTSIDGTIKFAEEAGYPVIIRPSYVLSGAAMRVARNKRELKEYIGLAAKISRDYPVVVSKFIENAKELEVDAVCDGRSVLIGAIIEHIEQAGTHSGDANMVIPPQNVDEKIISKIENYTTMIAKTLRIRGPFNIQFVVKGDKVYVIELNLRASRSMPFSSKSNGIPLIWAGSKVMVGRTLDELKIKSRKIYHASVKSPTFSFSRIKGADPVLDVEMSSTGEAACLDYDFSNALLKAFIAAGFKIPKVGSKVLITVCDIDKLRAINISKQLTKLGYKIVATKGTANFLKKNRVENVSILKKISEGSNEILQEISDGKIEAVINTQTHHYNENRRSDGSIIRKTASEFSIPVFTKIETAEAFVEALSKGGFKILNAKALDDYFPRHVLSLI